MDDSAALFEAISHPVRIRILKILEKQPSSFASLKRTLGVDSSGNLDHHLKKLGNLVGVQEDGLYALTDAGKEALVSIKAIEAWKEEERLKTKNFSGAPRAVSILAFLELGVAIMATVSLLLFVLDEEFGAFSVLLLWPVHLVVAILGFVSFDGLSARKGWGWTVAVVQAALLLLSGVPQIYYASRLWLFSIDAPQVFTAYFPALVLFVVFFICGITVLLLALQPVVREFFGKKFGSPIPRRVLAGGVMGMLSGIVEIFVANIMLFPIGFLIFAAALLLSVGGLLILLRKYTLGGIMVLIFSLAPVPFYYVFLISNLLPYFGFSPLGYLVFIIVSTMPIAGGILALVSKN